MSIISCPQCGKKISSLVALCSFCGHQRGEVSKEQMLVYRQRRARNRVYHLNMLSYAVMALFLSTFGWYWWDSAGFGQPPSKGLLILMGLGAVAYLVVRGFLFMARHRQRELARSRF